MMYIPSPTPTPIEENINSEISYNCSKCSSLIEINSIDEDNIEFKCLNKESNHPKNIKMPLK